ncbi:MAG: hypothetical protein J6T48_10165 [Bacteroidales bacterium]|nr:hypothetical protein [Bacteroidales bacterium]
MNTYTKTLNVIDYSTMGLLSISAILAAANIPYALICFIVLWVLSIAIFITTSVKSGIYKESGSLFIYDLVIKIMIFASIEFWAQRDYVNISMAGLLVGYVIFAIMTKKIPVQRPIFYLLIYGVTTGVCAAITM